VTPIIVAWFIACTVAPTPTGQPYPNDYTYTPDCLDLACPNVTAITNDYKAQGRKLKLEDVLELGYMSQWHTAQCKGRG
jgi:hypothetical protein